MYEESFSGNIRFSISARRHNVWFNSEATEEMQDDLIHLWAVSNLFSDIIQHEDTHTQFQLQGQNCTP